MRVLFDILEELTLPSVPFMRKISPIQTGAPLIIDRSSRSESRRRLLSSEVDPEDVIYKNVYNDGEIEKHYTKWSYAYLKYRRGHRGNVGQENEDMFIFTGQNFVVSILFVILWIVKQILITKKLSHSKFAKVLITIFRTLFSMVMFDIQMIAVTQIAIHDFSRDQPSIYRVSYVCSAFVLVIIVFEICSAYCTLSLMSSQQLRKLKVEDMPKDLVSYDQALLFEEMAEGLSNSSARRGNTMMLDSVVHFLFIQMLIASL
jgi:membrane-bound metal-dependent hydrolase YbcI (DUF457 family)